MNKKGQIIGMIISCGLAFAAFRMSDELFSQVKLVTPEKVEPEVQKAPEVPGDRYNGLKEKNLEKISVLTYSNGEVFMEMYDFVDPKTGKRYLVAAGRTGIAMIPADQPILPLPLPLLTEEVK